MCLVKVWRDRVVLQFVFLCVALLAYISESSALQIVQRDSSDDWKRASIEVSDVSFSSVVSSENSTSNVSNCTDNDRVTGDNIVPRQLVILRPFNNSWASHLSIDELKEGVAQSYSFRLSSAPSGPVTVKLLTTSYATTDGRGYLIEVWGSTVSIPRDEGFHTFTFTTTDWCQPQVISFRLKKNSTVDAYVHKIKANFSVSGGGSFKGDHYIYWDKTIDDERSKRGIIVTPHPIEMGNAKKRTFQVKMAHAISVLVHVSLRKDAVEKEHGLILERVEDIPWITTRGSMFFNSNNWNVPQSVTIEAKDIVNRKPRHTFYIEASGGGHDGYTRDVIVTFGNTTPTVNITGLPSKINSTDELTATFTFSKDVTGFETGDITVSGATKGTFSGSGKSYTLPLTPNGSEDVVVTVAKDAATAGTNTGPATPETATAKWDSDPPGVEITGLPPYINSTDPLTVNFTFTEDVTGFKTGDITVSGALKGAFGNGTSNTFSGNGTNYTLWITPNGRKDVVVTVVKDAATDGLNSGPAAPETATAVWDSDPPDVRITGLPSKINSTAELTAIFTFTEDVTGFETNDITVTGATKGKFSGSGSNYRLLITPNGSADVVVTVGANTATDGLNTGPADPETVTAVWDDATPDVTIAGLPSKINSTAELTATFTFTEDVTEFETNDITVTGGTSGTFTATSATVYSLVITPTEDQNVVVTVSANAATNGLNTGPASDVTETAVWDDVTPDVTIAGLPSKINSTAELTATFTFTEDVTEFETNDITVTGGTSGTFTATSATVYSLVITPTEDQNVVVTVSANAATDGLNTGPASDVTETAVWDDVTPNVTITGLPPKINSTSPLTASFAFTEDVTGFITDDIKVSGATKGTFTANSATGYTLQIVPSGSENMEVTVIANAASDGINTGPAQDVIATSVWDGANPGVTISGVPPKINSQEPFTATFTFSENVTGFIADDVVITGAAKGTWSANSATTYTLVITPSGAQDVVVTIPANVATDGTNQGPSKAVTKTALWDADPPTVTISGLPENISTTDPLTATFTFSEGVTGFLSADVTVTGATKGTFTAMSSSSYTLAITPTGQQNVVVQVPVNVVSDGINMGPPQPVTVTSIWNSERMATLTVTSSQVEEGQSVQLSVNLSGAPFSRNVTIPLTYPRSVTNDDTATEPADYTQLRSVTIEAGSQTGSGSITTRDDDVYEGNEIFDVKLGTLPDEIKRGSPDLQTITIIENDTPPPVETTLRVDQTTVAEGGQVKVTARI
ncbi:MAG: Ig-like domain-containing protein, partial [Bacteroidetes bacterium]|nr:Ig-like domain-containing protein [Bacteroidota bacterium]